MQRRWLTTGLALVAVALAAPAAARPPALATRLSDGELAALRGGFALPNGIDIALAVQMDAAINGALVLRTVFRADKGTPTLAVYAPSPGSTGPAWSAPPVAAAAASTSPTLILDRGAGTTTLVPGTAVPTSVAVTTDGSSIVGAPVGLTPLMIAVGGPAVATAAGTVQLSAVPTGTRVDLNGSMIDISQLVGAAFVNAVQNAGNNRVIDTATTINVDLRNTAAMTAASAAARVADVVDQVAQRLVR